MMTFEINSYMVSISLFTENFLETPLQPEETDITNVKLCRVYLLPF